MHFPNWRQNVRRLSLTTLVADDKMASADVNEQVNLTKSMGKYSNNYKPQFCVYIVCLIVIIISVLKFNRNCR